MAKTKESKKVKEPKQIKEVVKAKENQPIYILQTPPKTSALSQLVALLLILATIIVGYILINYKVVLLEKPRASLEFIVTKQLPVPPHMGFFAPTMRRQFAAVPAKSENKTFRRARHNRGKKFEPRPVNQMMEEPNPPIKEAEIKFVPEPQVAENEVKQEVYVSAPVPVQRKAKYIESEYAPYQQKGNATISGKVCLTLEDNTEKCFPNVRVIINPVTSYSQEWFARGWAGTEYLEEADPRVKPTNLIQQTDANGAFAFKNLPAGSYYVGAEVCAPKTKDAKEEDCIYTRLGARVKMKNFVTPTFKKVFSQR